MRQHSRVLISLVVLALGVATVGLVGAAAPADSGLALQDNETANGTSNNSTQGPMAFALASPDDPGATDASHAFAAPVVDSTARLNGITINYSQTDLNVSGVTVDDISRFGVDKTGSRGGTRFDSDYTSSVSEVRSTNETVTVMIEQQTGNFGQVAEVIVVVDGMPNPESEGYYNLSFDVNPEQQGGKSTGQLAIGDVEPITPEEGKTLTHPSGSAGPGFTAAIGVAALLAVALLARFRS